MKWIIYYGITLAVNVISALVFHEHLSITIISIAPLFLITLSVFLAAYQSSHTSKKNYVTFNTSDLTEEEWQAQSVYMSASYVICIPLFLPFVLFFPTAVKLLSILLFLLAHFGGMICYRLKHGNALKSRLEQEARELDAQKQKEELGKWK